MKNYDVVVVGAGPAGGQCARLLSKSGREVLLVEQHEDFDRHNFSSAGVPLQTLAEFDLPEDIVGSFWQKIEIVTTNISRTWESDRVLGAVLNFAKFREFLAREVKENGGEVWMGHRYIESSRDGDSRLVALKQRGNKIVTVRTKLLVDATGFARSVIYDRKQNRPAFLKATGIEYLIELEPEKYAKYSNALVFFLGHHWMPKGYSWIFPMETNRLKVGSACFNAPHKHLDKIAPLKDYLELILKEFLKTREYKIIDVHGSIIEYSEGLNDIYYRDNIVAIGDAVSTVNPLGGEGIRYAMHGAKIANKYISNYLNSRAEDFQEYRKEMRQNFATKWNLCEKMSKKVYLQYGDEKIDKGVAYLTPLKVEDMVDILFYYKFERVSKGLGSYLARKLDFLIRKITKIMKIKSDNFKI